LSSLSFFFLLSLLHPLAHAVHWTSGAAKRKQQEREGEYSCLIYTMRKPIKERKKYGIFVSRQGCGEK
jgi:hypothetical protein